MVPAPAATPDAETDPKKLKRQKVAELRAALEALGQATDGTKPVLVARLVEARRAAARGADGGPATAPAATEEAEPTTAAPEPAATAELAPEPASTTAADISARPCRTLDDQYASMAERLSNLNRMADEALARQEEYLARN